MQEFVTEAAGTGGWIAVLALVVGFAVRLVKSDRLDTWLNNLGLPSVPKPALPWLALALGALGGGLEAVAAGKTAKEAVLGAFYGLLSGALAIAGNETVGHAAAKASPAVGRVVFAKSEAPK